MNMCIDVHAVYVKILEYKPKYNKIIKMQNDNMKAYVMLIGNQNIKNFVLSFIVVSDFTIQLE